MTFVSVPTIERAFSMNASSSVSVYFVATSALICASIFSRYAIFEDARVSTTTAAIKTIDVPTTIPRFTDVEAVFSTSFDTAEMQDERA